MLRKAYSQHDGSNALCLTGGESQYLPKAPIPAPLAHAKSDESLDVVTEMLWQGMGTKNAPLSAKSAFRECYVQPASHSQK